MHRNRIQGAKLVCIGANCLSASNVLMERTGNIISVCLGIHVEWIAETVTSNMNLKTSLHRRLPLDQLNSQLNSLSGVTASYEPEIINGAMDVVVQCVPVRVVLRFYFSGKVVVLKCVSQHALSSAWERLSPHLPHPKVESTLPDADAAFEMDDATQMLLDNFEEMVDELGDFDDF